MLCKGVNDRDELSRTLADLACYYPTLQSVAVVPAGITAHREGLYPLEPFHKAEAAEVLDQINAFGDTMLTKHGTRLVFPSDEWYLTAERPLPDEDYYEGYPQLENGVGMITSMRAEFDCELDYLSEDYDLEKEINCSIATGKAAYSFIKSLIDTLTARCKHFNCRVYEIENDFFGHTITVAGLVTGGDLIAQLKDKPLGDFLVLPRVMLRDEGDRFLDDTTLDSVSTTLKLPIRLSQSTGDDFIRVLLS